MKFSNKLNRSVHSFLRLFESEKSATLIIDAVTGRIIEVNPVSAGLLNYSVEELIEKKIWDISLFKNIIPDKEKLQDIIKNGYYKCESLIPETDTCASVTAEITCTLLPKKDNELIRCRVRILKKKESPPESIEESNHLTNQYLDILFNHAHVPIIIWDSSMVVTHINKAFEDLTGFEKTGEEQIKLEVLFPKDKIASSLDLIRYSLSEEKSELIELDIVTKENDVKTVLWNSTNIFDKDGKNVVATVAQDITKRKRTEDSLAVLETRYRRLFESAKDGIVILDAETGSIIDVNPFLIQLLGYTKEKFLEKEIWEIGFFKDITANKEKFIELQQNEYVRYDNLPLETADGRKISVEFVSNVYLVNNKKVIQCNIRDNTERKRAENSLRISETRLRTLIQTIPDLIWLKDINGVYLLCNNMFGRFFGADEATIAGKTDYDFVDSELADFFRANDRIAMSAGKPTTNEEWITFADDRHRVYLETIKAPMYDSNNTLMGILGIGRDITERKNAEKALIEAKVKAEESDRLKTSFLANMSHEIRTPMNGILGFTELLKKPHLSGIEQQEYIHIIEKSGARMLNIINDIVNIAKVEAGQMEISVAAIDINEVLDEVTSFFKREADIKKLKIHTFKQLAYKDAIIHTDREKLIAILTNLVKNAIKFTDSGLIEIGYSKKGDYLEFFVKDTGIGIPVEQREFIFDRFRQGSESLSRNYEGAGLGLSISKAYVEMLGGEIWVGNHNDSAEPEGSGTAKGSVLFFNIPYNQARMEKALRIPARKDSEKENQLFNLKLLIAEDDRISQKLIEISTVNIAREVITVATGAEAVEACRMNPDIDLILMDIKMPGMDGYEATRQIRTFNSRVAIIAQTAYALSGERARAIEAGCDDYISKPLDLELLIKLIKRTYRNRPPLVI
jgi:PAS domain S-box-containing protein